MSELPSYRYTEDKLGFYVAANDQDMLDQINRLLHRSGCVGIMDTAGRMHYLIDGRRGPPFASRRILEAAGRLLCDRLEERTPLQDAMVCAVDDVLTGHAVRPELKGYRYLRYLLLSIGLEETKLRPMTKTLYPAVAAHFHVGVIHVERDIRYALRQTDLHQQGLAPTAAICRLYNEIIHQAETEQQKEKPSGKSYNCEGFSYQD